MRFRDGKSRVVAARELASGRIFEQICRAACQAAFLRDVRGEEPGLQVRDINDAVSDVIQRLASTLSVRNAAAYLHAKKIADALHGANGELRRSDFV